MKKLLFTFLAVSLIFSSCNKEDLKNDNCNIQTLTDIDGNTYNVVSIGNQCWTKENLNVSRFLNGDEISNITGNIGWSTTTSPAWCYYDNKSSNGAIYGKLYNHIALNDPRGIAPKGWRIPTEADYNELFNFLGGADVAGKHMKVNGDGNFGQNNTGTNSSGFSALPGGWRTTGTPGQSNQGSFATGGIWANFAAADLTGFYITDYKDKVSFGGGQSPCNGNSVRLIKE